MYEMEMGESFLHKRIGRAIGGFIGGGPTGALAGLASGGGSPSRPSLTSSRATSQQLSGTRDHLAHGHSASSAGHAWMTPELIAQAQANAPGNFGRRSLSGGGGCPPGTTEILGQCIDFMPGGAHTGAGLVVRPGEAVRGLYGAALEPQFEQSTTRRCIRGMVLGKDGLCYNKRQIRNADRQWPRGTPPLLTGGERKAIRIAATAGGKLARSKRSLQKASRALAKAC